MFELASNIIKTKEAKVTMLVVATAVGVMTAIHYYNQIKLTRMKIREMESSGKG